MEAASRELRKPTNNILSELSIEDWRLIAPYLNPVALPVRMILENRGKPIDSIYFIDGGLASIITGKTVEVEVGMVGYEGLTGISGILGASGPADNQTFMQISGAGHQISVTAIRHCMDHSPSLRKAILLFVNTFIAQLSCTAMANAKGSLAERLARWLLMAQDRLHSNRIPLTHEFLALMIGVRRAGVSVAVEDLVARGVVQSTRGEIIVSDRDALVDLAGPFYAASLHPPLSHPEMRTE